jgi:GTP-binding protein LepA
LKRQRLSVALLQERLEREYNLDLVTTAPTVVYKTMTTDGEELTVNSPGDLPEATKRQNISEPYVRLEMVTPAEYVGNLMELANNRRGEFVEMKYLTGTCAACFFVCLVIPQPGKGWSIVTQSVRVLAGVG